MTDQPTHSDDLALLALALERELEQGEAGLTPGSPAGSGSEETLARLYTEVLGLLPWELEPVAPPPALKARLLAYASGDETQDVAPPPPVEARPVAVPPIASPADRRTGPRPVITPVPPSAPLPVVPAGPAIPAASAPPPAARPVRPARWPLALAASLILALLGLSGYLFLGLQQQGEVISQLTRERNDLIAKVRELGKTASASGAELARLKGEMTDAQARLAFITSPGIEISPLHPTGQVAMPPDAYGMLFVAADHQHWHLSVRGLSPSGGGRQYQLWFIGPQGAVSGGTFTAAPGAPVNLSSAHMPAGTRAVIITLEPEAGTQAPTGPEVLRAAAPVKVL